MELGSWKIRISGTGCTQRKYDWFGKKIIRFFEILNLVEI